jgi:hypothetical protein
MPFNMIKIIKFYRKFQYGQEREFVHPDNNNEAGIIYCLTSKKTIDERTRNFIQGLSDNLIKFEEVFAPK